MRMATWTRWSARSRHTAAPWCSTRPSWVRRHRPIRSRSASADDPSTVTTRRLILSGGLQAREMAGLVQGFPADRIPTLHYGKGSYFALTGHAPFQRLIYPPPIPGALGIHYRRDLGGQARFGPDLEFVDAPDYVVDPATGAVFRGVRAPLLARPARRRLTPDYAGIRPKLHGPGEPRPTS